jgi:hypothetical protein
MRVSDLNVMLRTVEPPILPIVRPRPLEVRRSNSMLLLPSLTQKESSAKTEVDHDRTGGIMDVKAAIGNNIMIKEVMQ